MNSHQIFAAVVSGDAARVAELLAADPAAANAQTDLGQTPLHVIGSRGSEGRMVAGLLLSAGADRKARDKEGLRPEFPWWEEIMTALEAGDEEWARELLSGDPGFAIYQSERGRTPLHVAAASGLTEIAARLIEAGADVNADYFGTTPLHSAMRGLSVAACAVSVEMVRLLIANGASLHARDDRSQTPLHHFADLATGPNALPAGQLLLEHGSELEARDDNGNTPLAIAADAGSDWVAEFLLRNGADRDAVNGDGLTPLLLAARRGHRAKVRLFLAQGARPVEPSPLIAAVLFADTVAIDALLHANASLVQRDANGFSALDWAALLGRLDIAETLIAHGADMNQPGPFGPLLHFAAMFGYQDLAEQLLACGADPNIPAEGDGETPLIAAVCEQLPRIAELLLKHHADFNLVDEYGGTCLGRAIENRDWESAAMLIQRGADVNRPSALRLFPLQWAVASAPGSDAIAVEIAGMLVARGADVNAKLCGETALHRAADQGDEQWIAWLAQQGADMNAQDSAGKTILDCAIARRNNVIKRFRNRSRGIAGERIQAAIRVVNLVMELGGRV
jgi:ankyrin repeat protein